MENFDLKGYISNNPLLKEAKEEAPNLDAMKPEIAKVTDKLYKDVKANGLEDELIRFSEKHLRDDIPPTEEELEDILKNTSTVNKLGQAIESEIEKEDTTSEDLKQKVGEKVTLGALFTAILTAIEGDYGKTIASLSVILASYLFSNKGKDDTNEEILSEGNCPNCGASGQSGQWTGMYCKRCKYAA